MVTVEYVEPLSCIDNFNARILSSLDALLPSSYDVCIDVLLRREERCCTPQALFWCCEGRDSPHIAIPVCCRHNSKVDAFSLRPFY